MVTKQQTIGGEYNTGYVLAKIQMVTKLSGFFVLYSSRYVLAKIQMVTKPQINIIII